MLINTLNKHQSLLISSIIVYSVYFSYNYIVIETVNSGHQITYQAIPITSRTSLLL